MNLQEYLDLVFAFAEHYNAKAEYRRLNDNIHGIIMLPLCVELIISLSDKGGVKIQYKAGGCYNTPVFEMNPLSQEQIVTGVSAWVEKCGVETVAIEAAADDREEAA